jgi:chemotaxis signal transduction protein
MKNWLSKNLGVLVTVIIVVIGWVTTYNRLGWTVDQVQEVNKVQDTQIKEIDKATIQNHEEVAEIKKDIQYILVSQKQTGEDIRELVKYVKRNGNGNEQ